MRNVSLNMYTPVCEQCCHLLYAVSFDISPYDDIRANGKQYIMTTTDTITFRSSKNNTKAANG